MGVADDINSFGQSVGCALGISDCWKPKYDWSPEMCLAFGLGMVQGLPLSNDRSYESGMSEHNMTAKGDGTQLIQMYTDDKIIIKIDGESWKPETKDDEGNDIWNHESDKIWDVLNKTKTLTIELGSLDDDDKQDFIQEFYGIAKRYDDATPVKKKWREFAVTWCTNPTENYKRLASMVSQPLDGIDCRSFPEVDFPKLSDKWCREETNIKDDTQRICNTDEPVQGLGETKYREIAEWYCDKTPEDAWCRCYNATNPEKQCGGLYDQVSVVKQKDLGDTFCTEEGSIHQDICRGLCSSPTTVSRKQPASSAAWDTPEADAIIKACSGAKLNEIWEKDGEGKRKLTSNTFTGSAGTWNVGEWAPRVSLKTRDGSRCDSIKHRFEALTSAFQFPRDDVVNSLRCTHKACWAEGQQYKPTNFEEGCSGMFACGEGRASFKQSNDDVVLSCWRHRGTGEDPAEFLKKHGFGADALDPKNLANRQEKEEKKKRTKSDKLDNLANNTSLQVGTSFFSVICASCLCIVFMLNSRKK